MATIEKQKSQNAKCKFRKKDSGLVVREGSPEWSGMGSAVREKYRTPSVALARKYGVRTVGEAKGIATHWLKAFDLENAVGFGLPEVDDRHHVWRVPLVNLGDNRRVGELVLNAYTSIVIEEETTKPDLLVARLLGRGAQENEEAGKRDAPRQTLAPFVRNTVIFGDCEQTLLDMPSQSVDLIFTSPPYFNARPEYEDYLSYEEYLLKMRRVIRNCRSVLSEGRFFVMNISPVLIRRASRSEASRRIAVPFDMHRLFIEEGFDFIDDIHWVKPQGAGWATGRGRRFAADRNPLQYKAVPVTEYVLVYRKRTDKLIDWNIRNHPDQRAVKDSKIADDYEVTNLWRIHPAHHPKHPAVFPLDLAQRVVRYYSFKNDAVLDPFAGIGTTGRAAASLGRRFVLMENEIKYIEVIRREMLSWLGAATKDVLFVGCEAPDTTSVLL